MKRLPLIILSISILLLTSCAMPDLYGVKNCHRLELSKSSIMTDLDDNEIFTISAKTYQKDNTERNSTNIVWSFAPSESVEVVSSTANQVSFRVKKVGDIVLTAYDTSNSDIKKTVVITVNPGAIEDISLSKTTLTIGQREEAKIKVNIYPEGAKLKYSVWESSDTNVVDIIQSTDTEVSIRGGVPGNATITLKVTSDDGSTKTSSCRITVSEMELPKTSPRYISLSSSYLKLAPGGSSAEISATAYDGYNLEYNEGYFTWSSSDEEIVSIRPNGRSVTIVPNKTGYAEVKAKLEGYSSYDPANAIEEVCRVSVGNAISDILISPYTPPVAAKARSLSYEAEEPQMTNSVPIGKTLWFKADYLPSETTDKGISWSTSSDAIDISSNGEIVEVRAKKAGSADLIARSSVNPEVSSYVRIAVFDPYLEPDLSIQRIVLDPSSLSLEEGKSTGISAKVIFADGTVGTSPLVWSSSASIVETKVLNHEGTEILVNAKSATEEPILITATALSNPSVQTSAYVMIYKAGEKPGSEVKYIVPSSTSVSMRIGRTIDVPISFLPSDTTEKDITVSVTNDVISAVGNSSTVSITSNREGSSEVIIRSSNNPSVSSKINVNVLSDSLVVPSYIKLSETSMELEKDETRSVSATIYLTTGEVGDGSLTWSTSDNDKIILSSDGNSAEIKGLSSGVATVTVTSDENPAVKAELKVWIYDSGNVPGDDSIKYISPEYSSLSVAKGSSVTCGISYLPTTTTETGYTVSLSNANIEVSSSESELVIIGNAVGSSVITLTSTSNSSVSATINVNVVEEIDNPSYITLSEGSFEILEGESKSVTGTIYKASGDEMEGDINFSTSDSSIVSLVSSGNSVSIKGLSSGVATIKAVYSMDSSIFAELKVWVYKKGETPGSKITYIVPEYSSVFTTVGGSVESGVSFLPTGTSQKRISASSSSSNASVTVRDTTVIITGVQPGSADITITSLDNPAVTANISVTVLENEEPAPVPSYITLSKSSIELLVGTTDAVSAKVYMSDGSSSSRLVNWSTLDTDIISINAMGNDIEITALKSGIANIIAVSADDSSIVANLKIWAYKQGENPGATLRKISPESSSITMVEGSDAEISIIYYPSDTIDKSLNWTTDNGNVKVSSKEGGATITALSKGLTTVTATSVNNASIQTTVNVKVVSSSDAAALVRNITLTTTKLVINPPYPTGEAYSITARSEDASGNAIVDQYIWTIENTGIITGRANPDNQNQYLLTVKAPGSTRVTVQSRNNPNISASCVVEITGGLEEFTLSPSSLVVSENGSAELSVSFYPSDTTETDLVWTASGGIRLESNPNNPYSRLVRGISAGSASVTVKSVSKPSLSRKSNITVTSDTVSVDTLPVSIKLSSDTIKIAPPLTTPAILTAQVYGIDGMIYPIGVNWSIADNEIAELTTYDDTRVAIVARKAGETRVIATSIVDQGITASAILTVSGKINAITPASDYVTVVKGQSTSVSVALSPTDTIEKDLVWFEEGFDPDLPQDDASTPRTKYLNIRQTATGAVIDGLQIGQTRIIVRSKVRPEVQAIIAVDITEVPEIKATIVLSPTAIELGPDSKRTLVRARVTTENNQTINEDVIFTVDPVGLVTVSPGGSNEIYISPSGIAGEGTIYASLPSYPYIEAGKARLFVGGELRSLSADGSQSLAVNVGDTAQIKVKYNPSNTTETGIVWSSSNTQVARVDGGSSPEAIVTGISSGVATITAKSTKNSNIYVEFTVVVKSIINEIAFVDQNGNRGLTFYTDTNKPLTLACQISPDTAAQRKLIYKSAIPNFSMSTITPVNNTVNDIIFTPDPNAAGAHIYDIADTITGKVVGTLEINTMFAGLSINTTRHVFDKKGDTLQLSITSDSGDVSTDQIEFSSSDSSVATVDRNGMIRSVSPGETVITSNVKGANMKTNIYVNVDIPESLEKALRHCGYLPSSGDTILPSHLNVIRTLDLRNTPKSLAVDLSKIGTDVFPNLEILKIDGVSLSNKRLSLSGTKLKELYASDCQLESVTAIPNSLVTVVAKNNNLTTYSLFNSGSLKNLNLANNKITSYSDIPTMETADLSNNQIRSVSSTSRSIRTLNLANNQISSVSIRSDSIVTLNLNNNSLRYNNFSLEDNQNIDSDSLQYLYLANNQIGIRSDASWPEAGNPLSPSESTYNEKESTNRNHPLQTIYVDDWPSLRVIDLSNNHIRSGLNVYDKYFPFQISSNILERVVLNGNNIGNCYAFTRRSAGATISSVGSSGSHNQYGMTITYDHSGCDYTGQTWHNGWWLFGWHDRYMEYWTGRAYMY